MNDGTQVNVRAKVCLRRKDGKFYAGDGGWTAGREMAQDFEEASKALLVGRTLRAKGLEIVMSKGLEEYVLPIRG